MQELKIHLLKFFVVVTVLQVLLTALHVLKTLRKLLV